MLADGDYRRARPYPLARGRGGVEVIHRAAARIPAAERVARGTVSALGDGLVELSVVHAGEGVGLVDDAGNAVREGRVVDAVEYHGADRDLSGIRLSPRLGGNEPCEEIFVV